MANRNEKIVGILESWQDAVRPKSRLLVSEWAAKHRVLQTGRWDNKRTPYLVELMNALSERNPARVVVCMAGAQVGKSESGYNTIGYWIDEAPANIILALPTEKLYRMVSSSRIQPLIELTDTLRERFVAGGTAELKHFAGGALQLVTAKSAPSLRSMAARYVIADECDAYPHAIAGEGDPLVLLRRRMSTYEWESKFLITSTPLLHDSSRIAAYMARTDYRKYLVPCLQCGHAQPIEWDGIKWENNDATTARFVCSSCGHAHAEKDKTEMLAAGNWTPTQPAENVNWVGYHLSALYSPFGWYSWRQAVEEFIASKEDEYKRQAWHNTVLGLPYKHYGYRPTISSDTVKPENYDGDAPADVLVLTAGIDTQKDRVEMYVWGWYIGKSKSKTATENERTEIPCLVDFQVLHGDLAHNSFWHDLYGMMADARYKTADGRELSIAATAIDTGGLNTTEVYRFVQNSHATGYGRLYAIKGQPGYGKPIIGNMPSLIEHKKEGVGRVQLWMVGVDPCKSTIYRKINDGDLRVPVAFPGGELLQDEFFKQLTAESIKTKWKNGFANHVWVKDYRRNEALDCVVYAYAALKAINVDWDYLENDKGKIS